MTKKKGEVKKPRSGIRKKLDLISKDTRTDIPINRSYENQPYYRATDQFGREMFFYSGKSEKLLKEQYGVIVRVR